MRLLFGFPDDKQFKGLTKSLEETTEHRRGRKPPVVVQLRKKSRRGDRILNILFTNLLDVLSPFQGL